MPILNFFKKRKFLILPIAIAITFVSLFLVASVAFAACTGAGSCTISKPNDGTCKESFETGISTWKCVDNKDVATFNPATGMTKTQEDKMQNGGFWDWIGNIAFSVIFKIVYAVTYCIFYIFSILIRIAGALLDFVLTKAQFNQFAKAPIVVIGWGITKNLANMFFALILLIISFATILRIESYGIKQVLPRLIIAALLINFSLVIGGVIIDFTQVLTKYFVDAALEGTSGKSLSDTIAKKLQITQGIEATNTEAKTPPISESIDGLASAVGGLFAGIIVILIAAFVFFAAAILFIVRYIALLFLLILAPLAWFFYIVPMTRRYWDLWWSTFFKWAFFAPAYAFFLYLSMLLIKSDVMSKVGVDSTGVAGGFGRYTIPMLINYTIMIGFLLGGLIVAQKIGVWGGGAMLGWVKSAGRGFGRATGRWAARGAPIAAPIAKTLDKIPLLKRLEFNKRYEAYREKTEKLAPVRYARALRETLPSLLVPAVWKRAMAASRSRAEGESFPKAAGRLEGLLALDVKQVKLREQQAHNTEVARKEEEFKKIYKDEDQMIDASKKMTDPVEKEAMTRLMTSINAINTLLVNMPDKEFSPEAFKEYLKTTFKEGGARIAADVSGIAAANGNFGLVGMSKWNPQKQDYEFTELADQLKAVAAKMGEWEPQDWARRVHPDAFFKLIKDEQGNTVRSKELHSTGEIMIKNITQNHVDQVNRLQGRTVESLYNGRDNIRKIAEDVRKTGDDNRAKTIMSFIERVEKRYEGTESKEQKSTPPLAGGSTQEFKEARQQKPPGAFG